MSLSDSESGTASLSPSIGHNAFGPDVLALDCEAEAGRIEKFLVQSLRQLNRRGVVVGVSGGIDSCVCAMAAVRAVGAQRVFGLLMPERDSADGSTERGRRLCEQLGIRYALEVITDPLAAIGCYKRRDEAIAQAVPEYKPGMRHKIVISAADKATIAYFNIVVEGEDGVQTTTRLPLEAYLQVVAATNFKQRIRKNLEYYHADRLNYAVLGTPNKLEYDLGFFVRGGDGLADIKPIAHLYKTQVYALARHLGAPEEIRSQQPSTDTYSLPQTQEEFYYALPYDRADLVLYAMLNGVGGAEAAPALGLTPEQAAHVFRDFDGKRRAAARGLSEALRMKSPDGDL
jgi:NAD+ synthase